MGLDMYLLKRKKEQEQVVGYWRKANQIHHWFVENIQNGNDDQREYIVSKEQLIELLETCYEVLKYVDLKNCIVKDEEAVRGLLPTYEGFFFGRYDYGEDYIDDIKNTIKILKDVIGNTDFDKEDIYYSCWW